MLRMYGIYVGMKKNTSVDNFYYSYSGSIWCYLPTANITNTTIANHGRRQQKCPPSAPHEALHFTPMRWMDGRHPPEQANLIFGAVEGVYGPQNAPMLWWCIIARTKEHFESHTHPQTPKKLYPLARVLVVHPLEVSARSKRPHVGC